MNKNILNLAILFTLLLAAFDSRLALVPLVLTIMFLIGSTKPDF